MSSASSEASAADRASRTARMPNTICLMRFKQDRHRGQSVLSGCCRSCLRQRRSSTFRPQKLWSGLPLAPPYPYQTARVAARLAGRRRHLPAADAQARLLEPSKAPSRSVPSGFAVLVRVTVRHRGRRPSLGSPPILRRLNRDVCAAVGSNPAGQGASINVQRAPAQAVHFGDDLSFAVKLYALYGRD